RRRERDVLLPVAPQPEADTQVGDAWLAGPPVRRARTQRTGRHDLLPDPDRPRRGGRHSGRGLAGCLVPLTARPDMRDGCASRISSAMANEENRFSARAARYVRVGTNVGAVAARVAGERLLGRDYDPSRAAADLAVALGGLKGPLMKVAQFLSTIPDALPAEY